MDRRLRGPVNSNANFDVVDRYEVSGTCIAAAYRSGEPDGSDPYARRWMARVLKVAICVRHGARERRLDVQPTLSMTNMGYQCGSALCTAGNPYEMKL